MIWQSHSSPKEEEEDICISDLFFFNRSSLEKVFSYKNAEKID